MPWQQPAHRGLLLTTLALVGKGTGSRAMAPALALGFLSVVPLRGLLCCALASLFVIGLLTVITPSRAGSTVTVTTASDVTDGSDGLCSLREAIIAANMDAASGALLGECPAGSGADTINFSSALPLPAAFVLTRSGLLILHNVNIMNNTGGYGLRNQNGAYSDMNGGMVSSNQGGGVCNAASS